MSEKIKSDEVKILPPEVDEKVSLEIVSLTKGLNVTDEALEDLKERYSSLTIKDSNDKEGYVLVSESRKNIKAIRVAVEKGFKHLREVDRLIAAKKIAAEDKIVEFLSSLETPLHKMEKEYDEEKERIKKENAQKKEERNANRIADLVRMGASLDRLNWVLGDVSFESALVREADDEIYQEMLGSYKSVFDKKESDRLLQMQLQQEKDAEFERQQQELTRLRKEAKENRTRARQSHLLSMGMGAILLGNKEAFAYSDIRVLLSDVEGKEDADWEVIVADATAGIEKEKELAKEVQKRKEIFADRFPLLKRWSTNGSDIYAKGSTWGTIADIVNLSDEDFKKLVGENDKYITDQEEAKETQRKQDLQDAADKAKGGERIKLMSLINGPVIGSSLSVGRLSDQDWDAAYSEAKKEFDREEKRKADEKTAEENAKMNDKGRWEKYVAELTGVVLPEFKSRQYKEMAKRVPAAIQQVTSLNANKF